MGPAGEPEAGAVIEWRDGQPFSPQFGDVYRSHSGAWAQACSVYVQGCGLPEGWRSAEASAAETKPFVLLENGFGLGLNFLATWTAWRADARRCQHLHYVGIEAYPASADDVLRSAMDAVARHPAEASAVVPLREVPQLAQRLAQQWSTARTGWQTWCMEGEPGEPQLWLTLAVADAHEVLAQWPAHFGQAQAVYLDGFNPAVNPQMWSEALVRAVAERCAPGARVASYAVAGSVRRALRAAGFTVRKRPGLPPKWHRLEAVLGGDK